MARLEVLNIHRSNVQDLAMIQAVGAVVHRDEKPDKAFDLYKTLKDELA